MAVVEREIFGSRPMVGRGMLGIKKPWVSDLMRFNWANPRWREERIDALRNHPVSDETKKKIREAITGRRHTDESKRKMSLERGGRAIRGYPLFLRGASVEDVVQIAGIDRKKVKYLRDDLRKRGKLKRPTKEEQRLARRKSHLGKKRTSHGREYTPEQVKSIAFAKKLLKAGLITEDLTYWIKLNEIAQKQGKVLPKDFSESLRMEAYLAAKMKASENNLSLLRLLYRLGEQVDYDWFQGLRHEAFFRRDKINNHVGQNGHKMSTFDAEKYSSLTQKFVESIGSADLSLKSKKTFLIYWLYFQMGEIEQARKLLNGSKNRFRIILRQMLSEVTTREWKVYKEILDRVRNGI